MPPAPSLPCILPARRLRLRSSGAARLAAGLVYSRAVRLDQLLTRSPLLLTTPRSSLTARPDSFLPCVCGGAWRSLPSFCPLQIRWHPAALRSVRALFRLQPMPADVVHDRSIRQNSPAPAKGNGTGCCGGYGFAQRQKQALLQHPCARQKTIFRSLWSQLLKKLY